MYIYIFIRRGIGRPGKGDKIGVSHSLLLLMMMKILLQVIVKGREEGQEKLEGEGIGLNKIGCYLGIERR